jgi:protein gp37
VRGCSRVSEGCRNCYAERSAIRQKSGGYSGFVTTLNGHPAWTGRVELITSKLDEPLHWRAPRTIFVNSMSDLFHEALPAEDIAEVFRVMQRASWHTYQILKMRQQWDALTGECSSGSYQRHTTKLDWVIVGGESGPGARPFYVEWARSVVKQCKAAGVPCFVKQLGRFPNGDGFPPDLDYRERDLKGGDWDEWPEDLRVREFPA